VTGARILVVDDDRAILRAVRRSLEAHDYDVRTLESGAAVATVVSSFRPDVVVLDLVLPDSDGITICREIRGQTDASVLVLSAVGDEARKIEALDAGADDYVTKPFGMGELLARIRVALRRISTNHLDPVLTAGSIRLRIDARTVTVDGALIHLTPTEFELLRLLLAEQGRVLTHRFILERVWGASYVDDAHILRTFVHQLRQKLAAQSPSAAAAIITDPGIGYRLASPES